MKFRKLPVIIEAEPYHEGLEDGYNCYEFPNGKFLGYFKKGEAYPRSKIVPVIETLECNHEITPTDWIVTGVKGERYPVKEDIFRMTYEKVEDIPTKDEQCISGIYDGFDTIYIDDIGHFSRIQSAQYPTPIKVPYINTPFGKHYLTDYNPWVKTVCLRKLWDKTED